MPRFYHQGLYTPEFPDKYCGDVTKIVYRSSWERATMKWLDFHPQVVNWNSEDVCLRYYNPLDKKTHRYFVDFWVEFKSGRKLLIEIKPASQTKKPVFNGNKKRFLSEATTFIQNLAKWERAKKAAEENGHEFEVWTENTLHRYGIRLINIKPTYKNR